MILYHGTSSLVGENILREGLKTNKGLIFLTTDINDAVFMSSEASADNNSSPLLLKIRLPDDWELCEIKSYEEEELSNTFVSYENIPSKYIKKMIREGMGFRDG